MQSPFAIFRKNAKVMTIVLTGLAMFAFVILGSIDQMPELFAPVMGFVVGAALFWALSGKSGVEGGAIAGVGGIIGILLMVFIAPKFFGPKPEFVLNGKKITATEVNQLVNQRKMANQFIRLASTAVREQAEKDPVKIATLNRPPFFRYYDQSEIRKDVMIGYVLNIKADEMGVTISNDVVTDFINKEVTTNLLSKKLLVQVLRKLRISEKQLYDHLRRELRARFVLRMLSPPVNSITPVMPEELWEMFKKIEITQAMDIVPFEVESFVDTSQNPEEGKLEEFFNKYKDRMPNITRIGTFAPGEPGFKQPRRIQIGYFKADNREIEEEIRKKLEKEIIPKKEIEELKKNLQTRLLLFKAGTPGRIDRREIDQFEAKEQLAENQASTDLLIKMLSSPKPVKRLDYLVQEYYEREKEFRYKTFAPPKQNVIPSEKGLPDGDKTKLGKESEKEDDKKKEPKKEEKTTPLPPAPETNPETETKKENETKKEVDPKKTPLEKPSSKTGEKKETSLKQTEQTIKFVSFLKDEKKPLPTKEEPAKEPAEGEKKEKESKKKETSAPDTIPSAAGTPSEKEKKTDSEKEEKDPPKYRPLDKELKGEIEETIIEQQAQKAVEEQTQKAFEYMSEVRDKYFADVNRARMAALDKKDVEDEKNPQDKKASPEQEKEDVSKPGLTNEERLKLMKEYASQHLLEYVELEPLSGKELKDLAKEDQEISKEELLSRKLNHKKYLIGSAIELSSRRTVIDALFSQRILRLYSAGKAYDFKNGKQFSYWAMDDIATHTPQFSDAGIKKKVLKAWRITQAIPVANKRAKEISQKIQEGKLFTALIDFSMDELREELLSRGMKKELQGQEMLDWLKKTIDDHQDAISDIGIDTEKSTDKDKSEKENPKKEEPVKKATEKETDKKTDVKKTTPEKKEKKPAQDETENKKEKTSAINNLSPLQNVTYQEEKPSDKKVEKKDIEKTDTKKEDVKKDNKNENLKPKVQKPDAGSEKKTLPVKKKPKKKIEVDHELIELNLFLDAIYYSTDIDKPRFELNNSIKAIELLDWLVDRIDKPKGDSAKKEQLKKIQTELSLTGKKGSPLLSFKYAGSFSWVQQGRNGLALSKPVGIEKAGNDFMEYVFEKLKNGETGVIANSDHSITYVVTVRNRVDASKEKFMKDANDLQSFQSPFSRMIFTQQQNLQGAWFAKLMKEYGLNL
ncbi:hypothetical protein MNBD_PLANCTO02-1897 [hydrothermal vent metagenome]|uniref:Uncharacterized protein n=1 Tax=hydrothermal vent metagenome TaxID=652676 RepID=A0A3B1DXG0_9ZZZZ